MLWTDSLKLLKFELFLIRRYSEVSSQHGWAHAHLGPHAPKETAWGLRVLDEGVTSSLNFLCHADVIATFLAGRWGLGHQFWVRSFTCWCWHLCHLVHFSNSRSFVSVIHPISTSCWGWIIFWVPAVHVWQLSVAWLVDTCPLDAGVWGDCCETVLECTHKLRSHNWGYLRTLRKGMSNEWLPYKSLQSFLLVLEMFQSSGCTSTKKLNRRKIQRMLMTHERQSCVQSGGKTFALWLSMKGRIASTGLWCWCGGMLSQLGLCYAFVCSILYHWRLLALMMGLESAWIRQSTFALALLESAFLSIQMCKLHAKLGFARSSTRGWSAWCGNNGNSWGWPKVASQLQSAVHSLCAEDRSSSLLLLTTDWDKLKQHALCGTNQEWTSLLPLIAVVLIGTMPPMHPCPILMTWSKSGVIIRCFARVRCSLGLWPTFKGSLLQGVARALFAGHCAT